MPKKKGGKKSSTSKPVVHASKGYAVSSVTRATGLYSNDEKGSGGGGFGAGGSGESRPSPRYGYAAKRQRGAGPVGGTKTDKTPVVPSTTSPVPSSTTTSTAAPSHSSKNGHNSTKSTKPKINKKLGAKYASVLADAKTAMKGKETSAAERKKIRDARAKLKKMRKKLVGKGYGSLDTEKNKKGGYSAHGIYKALTGKKYEGKK